MAATGEERQLIVYGDVHYYFIEPTPRPLHHRFDKGSYIYLYQNASQQRGRIEIANNAGTPDQDAFTGFLDSSKVRQSYKHPTLCTITVDGFDPHGRKGSTGSNQSDEHHWRLPSTDPRDEGKFLFRLHTLDIYFWTPEDAHSFMGKAQKILQKEQIEILDAPPVPEAHSGVMSPVVQQLESVAITDPAYRNGQTRNSRTQSTSMISTSSAMPQNGGTKGTPQTQSPSATLGPSAKSQDEGRRGTPQTRSTSVASTLSAKPQDDPRTDALRTEEPAQFTPLPYNPASPPAPEPIKPREKTPPPPEAEAGTGLAAAAIRDHSQAQLPQSPPSHGQSPYGFGGPPQKQQTTSALALPPPSTGYMGSPTPLAQGRPTPNVSPYPLAPPPPPLGRNPSNAPTLQQVRNPSGVPTPQQGRNPSSASTPQQVPPYSPSPHGASSVSSPPPPSGSPYTPSAPNSHAHLYGEGNTPLESPSVQILGKSYIGHPPQPLQHLQPQYPDYLATHPQPQQPIGGYSDYRYDQPHHQHSHHSHGNEYDIHSQVYRPTEEEVHGHGGRKPSASGSQQPGRLEQGADKLEKGVSRFLKKLDKKIG
ncbi:hypothetical protein MMC20_004626 [Loxospora ochrophaea]|nr:hypothetical protein [Loxospora ochrophaea]